MSNDRLHEAMARAGLTTADLAEKVGVDPKTAERWITLRRLPYPRHRFAIAQLTGESQAYLWPDAMTEAGRNQAAASEIVHVYPHRAGIPADHWRRLIKGSKHGIDMLMYSGMFLVDENPRLAALLRQRAEAGVGLRILVGDPEAARVHERGAEEGIDDALAAKIRSVLVYYRELAGVNGAEVRLHGTTLYNSIYRFDDEMLVNAHVYGFPAAHAPVLHLRKLSTGLLFDTYAESFKRVWTAARPAWPRSSRSGRRKAG